MNVLLTCAGRRSYLVSWFRAAVAPAGRVVAVNSHPLAAAMVTADSSHVAPPLISGEYVDFVLDVCRREEIGLVVPLFDLELPLLAAAADRFAAGGVVAAVSSADVVAMCRDKLALAAAVRERTALDAPRTSLDPEDGVAWLRDGAGGLFVKPRYGTGSIATISTTEADEVAVLHRKVSRDLRSTYLDMIGDGSGGGVVVQEALTGQEHGLTIVNDLSGRFRAVLVNRKMAMRAGETDVAEVVDDAVLATAGRELGETLGHVGALDVDVFVDEGVVSVLDVNPRFGGNYPFAHLAGADVPRAYVRWARGEDVSDDTFAVRAGTVGLKSIEPLVVPG